MAQPQTLLQMSGAKTEQPRLAVAALILIDCQLEYVDGRLALPGVDAALKEAGRLLAKAREAGAPIIHVVHQGAPGGMFDLTGHSGAIAPEVAARPGEATVTKRKPNAFADTNLNDLLKSLKRTELVIAGFMTHMCVSSTVRAGLDLGYRSTVVAKAAGTRDLPAPDGGVIKAADLHRAALTELADRFAIIVPDAAALR
ncbi:MAG: cysteine hydrolase [Proteobacteria bacterium]|nr:cysteine hydrolase [Pseudomonadota bacterium]